MIRILSSFWRSMHLKTCPKTHTICFYDIPVYLEYSCTVGYRDQYRHNTAKGKIVCVVNNLQNRVDWLLNVGPEKDFFPIPLIQRVNSAKHVNLTEVTIRDFNHTPCPVSAIQLKALNVLKTVCLFILYFYKLLILFI